MEKEGLAKQEWIAKAGGNFNHEALAFKYLPGKGCSLIAKRPIKKGTRGLPTRQDESLLAVPHSFSLSLANSSTSVRNKVMEFHEQGPAAEGPMEHSRGQPGPAPRGGVRVDECLGHTRRHLGQGLPAFLRGNEAGGPLLLLDKEVTQDGLN
ncbi:hypothetical protein QOT17_020371 [Balamuthia mandrillaris]